MIRSLASDAPTIGTAEAEGKARLTSETARPFRQLWRRLETTLRYTDLFRIDFLLWIPTFFLDFVLPCWCLPNCKLGACQTANWVRPDSGFRNHRPFFTINHVDHKLLEILLLHSPSARTHRFWPPEFGSRTPNLFIQPHSHPHHLLGLLEGWGPISSSFRTVLLQNDLIFDESALNVTLTNCLKIASDESAFMGDHGHMKVPSMAIAILRLFALITYVTSGQAPKEEL